MTFGMREPENDIGRRATARRRATMTARDIGRPAGAAGQNTREPFYFRHRVRLLAAPGGMLSGWDWREDPAGLETTVSYLIRPG
jgi:hypothetical protein